MVVEVLAVVVAGIALFGRRKGTSESGGGGETTGGDQLVPANDPARENDACTTAAALRPKDFQGRAAPPGMAEADWLARVALWSAYPDAPPDPSPDDPVYGPALARLRACVVGKLPKVPSGGIILSPTPKPNPGPLPPPPAPKPAPPPIKGDDVDPYPSRPTPTPGFWYQIKLGDIPFGVSSQAYGTASGTQANYQAFNRINNAPENKRFWRPVPSEATLFPNGRISFFPIFGTVAEQRANAATGGDGSNFAFIYIPPAA